MTSHLNSPAQATNCPIEALMEEYKLVVTEKYDIEYRDESIIIKITPFNF